MTTRFTPLIAPILDPRSERELVRRCMQKVYSSSGGALNDFAIASPTRALLEAQAFAGAEWLYYLNQLPEAFSIRFLQVMGIQRRLGSAATTSVTFTLTAIQTVPYTIPQGFVIGSTRALYSTDSVLTIPAGSALGTVGATCQTIGEIGNAGAFEINRIIQPLSYLKSVGNPAATPPALGLETLDEVKDRAFSSIRRRGLVSADDYNQEALSFLGQGAAVFSIGLLSGDKETVEKGAVHVFVLNPDGTELDSAQLSNLEAHLTPKTHLGTSVYISNVLIQLVDVTVLANVQEGQNPFQIADLIYRGIDTYLSPGVLPLGKTILVKELEYEVRQVPGVSSVVGVLQGNALSPTQSADMQLPKPYSAARLWGLNVTLIQGKQSYDYTFGNGDPD